MRRTLWTLLCALLLQLAAGSAWAWRSAHDLGHNGHCHETATPSALTQDTGHPESPTTANAQTSDHHCCAVGLGSALQAALPPLPQAAPRSRHGPWASLSLRPDLRPPI